MTGAIPVMRHQPRLTSLVAESFRVEKVRSTAMRLAYEGWCLSRDGRASAGS